MSTSMRVESLSVKTKGKSPKVLVDSLDFELFAGRSVNLVGETGSGKSLIAQAILGNISDDLKTSGKVWIDDTEYMGLPKSERRTLWGKRLGLLPQEPWLSLNPTKRTLHQLSEVYELVLKRSKRKAISSAEMDLAQLKIENAKEKFPHQLSGGMAQRLVFCCTLASGAEILIVDEPTKGLDSDRKDEIIQQLLAVLELGRCLLVITHDIEVAEKLGGETFVMRDGTVQEHKETELLFAAPSAPYTKALIRAVPSNWPDQQTFFHAQQLIVSARGLAKKFNSTDLFSNVDLEIHRGEVIGLYGPSGSGKSTLGNILLGLINPDKGNVSRKEGFASYQFLKLYQDPPAAFSPFHSVQSSMDDFLELHQINQGKFEKMLGRLNLDRETLSRDPGNISGGELQRCAILRALLLNPVFLFADEPTSRLDSLTQKETLNLICLTAREINCGVLLVSHDYELLKKSCDRIININNFH
jgi:peptide/nickel transport system ATP-binding protein